MTVFHQNLLAIEGLDVEGLGVKSEQPYDSTVKIGSVYGTAAQSAKKSAPSELNLPFDAPIAEPI